MVRTLTTCGLCLFTILLFSCGSSKKLETANATISDLQAENARLNSANSDLNKQITNLNAQHASLKKDYSALKSQYDEKDRELKEMNAIVEEFKENIEELEKKIETAEADFADKGLDVYSKDGIIFVNMEDNLLYKSGSAKLSEDGKKALGNLAGVLSEYPNLKVIVVGNTDTMHVKGVADNWSLSTERANGVVRLLTKEHGINPARLTAAGKGKFNPVAANDSEEGRAKNRRTEIVLNPDWERLWQSVKKD